MNTVLETVQSDPDMLTQHIVGIAKGYMKTIKGKIRSADLNLHQLVLEEIEPPLFRTVMEMTRYNQSKAAHVLGVSRGTLRAKLKRYFDDEFIGTRESD